VTPPSSHHHDPPSQAAASSSALAAAASHKQLLQIPGMGSLYGRSRVALSPRRHSQRAGKVLHQRGIISSGIGAWMLVQPFLCGGRCVPSVVAFSVRWPLCSERGSR
jgi:hypothetical protein